VLRFIRTSSEIGIVKMKLFDRQAVVTALSSAAILGITCFQPMVIAADFDPSVATESRSYTVSDSLARKLQAALDKTVQNNKFPGAVVAIVSPKGTWLGASGVSNLATKSTMKRHQLFLIGSTTKAFTGVTLLKLQERGQLSLEDTVGKWLPDIVAREPAWQNVTIRQLLNGRSGIYDYTNQWDREIIKNPSLLLSKQWKPEELIALAYGKPRFVGKSCFIKQKWCYPNTGNILAGLIVERATGLTYASVLRREILQPLKLHHTSVASRQGIPTGLARSYRDINGDGIPEDITDYDLAYIIPSVANGAIISNARDLARFNRALFHGKLLEPDSLKQLLTLVEILPVYGYGLGVDSSDTNFGKELGKGGDTLGQASNMQYFPEKDLTVIVLINQEPTGDFNKIPQIILSDAILKTFLSRDWSDR
jgi:D-alanyl-D-alanine carboxypeptidase